MSKPEILRSNTPHQVEVTATGKDASRRHAQERQGEPELELKWTVSKLRNSPPVQKAAQIQAQLSKVDADPIEEWPDDQGFKSRLDALRQKNQSLAGQLDRFRRAGLREEPHE